MREVLRLKAVIARGIHLLPYRTEKLSPLAPMVLHLLWESRSPPPFYGSLIAIAAVGLPPFGAEPPAVWVGLRRSISCRVYNEANLCTSACGRRSERLCPHVSRRSGLPVTSLDERSLFPSRDPIQRHLPCTPYKRVLVEATRTPARCTLYWQACDPSAMRHYNLCKTVGSASSEIRFVKRSERAVMTVRPADLLPITYLSLPFTQASIHNPKNGSTNVSACLSSPYVGRKIPAFSIASRALRNVLSARRSVRAMPLGR